MRTAIQPSLFPEDPCSVRRQNSSANKLDPSDRRFHDWYRFVLSFPPHLVREYLDRFGLEPGNTVLDPFSGTGTTAIEARLRGLRCIGIEANPMAHFAGSVKTDWTVDPTELLKHADTVATRASKDLASTPLSSLRRLPDEAMKLLLTDSISPLPLHKTMVLLEVLKRDQLSPCFRHEVLALAKALVFSISNLHFGPEVGVQKKKKEDAPVIESWLEEIRAISEDLRSVPYPAPVAAMHLADARQLTSCLPPNSIDAVFTSPPYPNEKDYTRTTRLESVLLGFLSNKSDLRLLKQGLLRSNTRNVYKGDDDDVWIERHSSISEIAEEIERRRIAMGKTSGFEKLYGKVTRLYFGGMARHLAELRPLLKPGAFLGYVVGDQASYLRVMIRTGHLLAEIAGELGYRVVGIDLFRTRLATATKLQMREEVVVLQWPEKQVGI